MRADSSPFRDSPPRKATHPLAGWPRACTLPRVSRSIEPGQCRYRSIFTSATRRERIANFEAYWAYSVGHDGEILQDQKDLVKKRDTLAGFQAHPVQSRRPLADPARFYRNHVIMQDDPRTLDRKTLLLTFLYKFARHEYVGISAAWDTTERMTPSTSTIAKIGLYHLCEEFSHMRLFQEIFRTFHLDTVDWVPLGKWMSRLYRVFPLFPEAVLAPPAFVSELMGLTVYQHLDGVLDDILADEPEARERVRTLLQEVMTDELAHVGQRRNFLGPLGLRVAQLMVQSMYRAFFREIPETTLLFNVEQMVRDGNAFDYSTIEPAMLEKSWMPSYCKA
jgi:hypothetical protein